MIKIDAETQFKKSLMAQSISEGRMDQKPIFNFVQPNLVISEFITNA